MVRNLCLKTFVVCLTLFLLTCSQIKAEEKPGWEVLKSDHVITGQKELTISGKVKGGTISLDMETLLELPNVTYEVTHPTKRNKNSYTGINLWKLLKHLEVEPDAQYLEIKASNKYKALAKIEDVKSYDYILSYKINGKMYDELPVSQNRGPLAVVINFDKHPEINYDIYKHQLVWFVESITVK